MRFLCLHGKGTSAAIFKSQTASFRRRLDPSITFDFVNGPFTSNPAPDIVHFYPAPYFSFWQDNTINDIKASHAWLEEKLTRDGPYDGVLLFSQGCALISSFLLYHQAANPGIPPPFKVAVFICGGIPLMILEDLGIHVSPKAHEWDQASRVKLQESNQPHAVLTRGKDRWAEMNQLEGYQQLPINLHDVFGLDVTQLPEVMRIQIPTVHIYGVKDPRFAASLQLAQLCDGRVKRVFDHGGGHDIPRTDVVSERIAQLITWAAQMAETG